jgi:hypothetical protein
MSDMDFRQYSFAVFIGMASALGSISVWLFGGGVNSFSVIGASITASVCTALYLKKGQRLAA